MILSQILGVVNNRPLFAGDRPGLAELANPPCLGELGGVVLRVEQADHQCAGHGASVSCTSKTSPAENQWASRYCLDLGSGCTATTMASCGHCKPCAMWISHLRCTARASALYRAWPKRSPSNPL